MRSFGDSIYTRKAGLVGAEEDQSNVLENIVEFNDKYRPKSKEGKDKKKVLMKVDMLFMMVQN